MKRAIILSAIGICAFSIGCTKDNPVSHTAQTPPNPYMYAEVAAGPNLYVACQRLVIKQGAYGPAPAPGILTGLVVVVSTTSDSVVDTIPLQLKNTASMDTAAGNLLVSSTGEWGALDGGIEKISMSTGADQGVCVTESALGGDVTSIVMTGPTKGYALVAGSDYTTHVKPFNTSTGVVGDSLPGVGDAFGGLAFDGTYLYIGDRDQTHPGILVFDPSADTAVSKAALDVGMPPYALAILRDPSTGIPTGLIATTSDFSSGNLSALTIPGFVVSKNLLSIDNDNNVATYQGSVYVLERLGVDRVSRYDGAAGFGAAPAWQRNLTPGANIYAIAFASQSKAYVTQYGNADLLVLNPATGSTITSIDLGKYSAAE